ncbi:MAG: hypothetical protein LUH05_05910 [Candidatus Gastranaerophilales bacterium]|nr:hypothetical protein [Candidatus Gastranaerophilales bacterium]
MTPVLECILAVFIIVLIVVAVVLTIFTVKLFQEAALALMSIKELTDMAKKELAPALISLNKVLATVNNVSNATNKQFELVKKILTTLLGASCVAFTNVKGKGGFFSGLVSGFNMFRKKRR